MPKKQLHRRPLLRCGGGAVKGCGFDAATLAQGHDKGPLSIGNGRFNFFVVITAVGQDHHVTRAMGTDILVEVQLRQILDHSLMLGHIHEVVIQTVALTVKCNGAQRHQNAVED